MIASKYTINHFAFIESNIRKFLRVAEELDKTVLEGDTVLYKRNASLIEILGSWLGQKLLSTKGLSKFD